MFKFCELNISVEKVQRFFGHQFVFFQPRFVMHSIRADNNYRKWNIRLDQYYYNNNCNNNNQNNYNN